VPRKAVKMVARQQPVAKTLLTRVDIAIDEAGWNLAPQQRGDLLAHERLQRGDDHTDPSPQHRRQLKAQRLAKARRTDKRERSTC